MNNVIVYGTLKRNGRFSDYLKESKFIKRVNVSEFKMYDSGYGFPFIINGGKEDVIYGELYEVSDRVLRSLDIVENTEGGLYKRVNLQDSYPDVQFPTYIYVSSLSHFDANSKEIPYGYWSVDNDYLQIMKVRNDDRVFEDIAKKIVFHMRFFDGDRTPTNKSYMRMVKKRTQESVNTEIEEIFITDLILLGYLEDLSEEENFKIIR
tara:strand:- start:6183 stop:6803 length:621 start_codon:yes stop_codon:yes gene_type:complete